MPNIRTDAELIDDVSDVLSDTCDQDVSWSQYAKAVVRYLRKEALLSALVQEPTP